MNAILFFTYEDEIVKSDFLISDRMKATEQYFPCGIVYVLPKVVLTLECMH